MSSKYDKVPELAKGALIYHKQVVVFPDTKCQTRALRGLLRRAVKRSALH